MYFHKANIPCVQNKPSLLQKPPCFLSRSLPPALPKDNRLHDLKHQAFTFPVSDLYINGDIQLTHFWVWFCITPVRLSDAVKDRSGLSLLVAIGCSVVWTHHSAFSQFAVDGCLSHSRGSQMLCYQRANSCADLWVSKSAWPSADRLSRSGAAG